METNKPKNFEKVAVIFKGQPYEDGNVAADTLVFEKDVTFSKGDRLQLHTQAFKKQDLKRRIAMGKFPEDKIDSANYVIDRMSEKVRADAVYVENKKK